MSDPNIIRDEALEEDCRETYSRNWRGVAFNWFRGYNAAMAAWLSEVTLDRPEEPLSVPVKYQTPERAFANYVMPRVNGQVDLPIISFIMTSSGLDRSRFFSPPNIVWNRQRVGNNWQLEPRPLPWEINYNVTVWAKFQDDLDLIAFQLFSRFTPVSYLYAYNRIPALMDFVSHTDTSDLEGGETKDRVLRNDYTFKVQAWVPLPYREVGTINKIFIEFTDREVSFESENIEATNLTDSQDINIVEGEFIEEPGGSTTIKAPEVIIKEE